MHYSAAIGFSASDEFFAEHPLSRNSSVNDIACINEDSMPPSNWSNVAYEITNTGQPELLTFMRKYTTLLLCMVVFANKYIEKNNDASFHHRSYNSKSFIWK